MNGIIKSLAVLILFFVWQEDCFCQDNSNDDLQIRQMLSRISYLQQHHEQDFPKGMIASYRTAAHRKGVLKCDDNIFFTGLVVFTLRYLFQDLDKPSQNICDSIFSLAAPVYKRHQNRKGRSTYN